MKFLLVLVFVILVLSQDAKEIRRIQILPSINSKANFQEKIIEISREDVEKYLVGQTDFTFLDITEQEDVKPVTFFSVDYPEPRRGEILKPILTSVNTDSTKGFMSKLTSFPSRRSTVQSAQDSVLMIKKELETIINTLSSERKKRFKIELIPIRGYVANSMIVTFEGSGSNKEEFVLFGAHADDVGHKNAGADDDGSGTTAVFESFRVIAQSTFNPSRSLVWLFYSAEESGLVGSAQIARDWKTRNMKVVGHLNYDMVGNHQKGMPLAGRRLTLNTTPKITEYTFKLSKLYTKLDINTWAFNGGSDHISWTRNGYESACLSERHFSPHYHRASDKIENVDFDLINEFARLGASYLVELA